MKEHTNFFEYDIENHCDDMYQCLKYNINLCIHSFFYYINHNILMIHSNNKKRYSDSSSSRKTSNISNDSDEQWNIIDVDVTIEKK